VGQISNAIGAGEFASGMGLLVGFAPTNTETCCARVRDSRRPSGLKIRLPRPWYELFINVRYLPSRRVTLAVRDVFIYSQERR